MRLSGLTWSSLLALAGCNTVFSLEPTTERISDARYFDAPIDAPFACTPLGAAPPRYSRALHQITQDCTDYSASPSTGLATVLCRESTQVLVEEGPLDGPFVPSVGIDSGPGLAVAHPRLSPEGDELFTIQSPSGGPGVLVAYARQSNGSWLRAYDVTIPFAVPSSARIGRVTRGPARRVMIGVYDGYVHELEFDRTGASKEVGTYGPSNLGGANYTESAPNLSADGLRMIYDTYGDTTVLFMGYADRPNVDAPFGAPRELDGVPSVFDPVMTEDCSRIYFSGVSSLLWIQQL